MFGLVEWGVHIVCTHMWVWAQQGFNSTLKWFPGVCTFGGGQTGRLGQGQGTYGILRSISSFCLARTSFEAANAVLN